MFICFNKALQRSIHQRKEFRQLLTGRKYIRRYGWGTVWIIKLEITGKYDWTYSRKVYRPSIQESYAKTMTGTVIASITEYQLTHYEWNAKAIKSKMIDDLQRRGFKVDTVFEENDSYHNLKKTVKIVGGSMPKGKGDILSSDLRS